jgi:hypothetical protein
MIFLQKTGNFALLYLIQGNFVVMSFEKLFCCLPSFTCNLYDAL